MWWCWDWGYWHLLMLLIFTKTFFCPASANLFHMDPSSWDDNEKLNDCDNEISLKLLPQPKLEMFCSLWKPIGHLPRTIFLPSFSRVVTWWPFFSVFIKVLAWAIQFPWEVELSQISYYHMSMSLLNKSFIERLDKLKRIFFFWQGCSVKRRYHLVKWSKICRSKNNGCLVLNTLKT